MLKALWRRTPFRIMTMLVAAFLVFLLLTGFTAVQLIRTELDARMEQQLVQSFSVIAQSFGENDLADLIDSVESNATANPRLERVFLLRSQDKAILAGNVTTAPDDEEWSVAAASALGIPRNRNLYRLYSGPVGPYTLLVGASFAENEEIGSIALRSLGLTGALFMILVVAAGIVLANRGQRRLDGIVYTMTRIGHGELSARIPLSDTHDDVDDLSRQINQALDRLAGLVEGMRQVSVDIAHDLKTPLNRLSFTVQNAIDRQEHGQPQMTLLLQAQAEIRQINTTFDALLRITQIESGARRDRFKQIAIGQILETLVDAYIDVVEENGHVLLLNYAANLHETFGDKDLLTQLFANLIENAIRHCPQGTTIAIDAHVEGQRLVVTVSDNGFGIPLPEHEKVFQRLYRLDKSRSTPGNGLGLSLVKAIADLHYAAMTVADNEPGVRFSISFPLSARLS
ncbi:MAG: two-component sensor histidine kinase [Hyphomicrobiales bacterium]|nr:two-component sensor histidine kinase [Hyphomicrobiales bacterium]